MGRRKPRLTVIRSPVAQDELHGVWVWNAQHYGPSHADSYLRFIEQSIKRLEHEYALGNSVAARPDLRYMIMRRKATGHGHVVVYRHNDKQVDVLHVFHTAQDWQGELAG